MAFRKPASGASTGRRFFGLWPAHRGRRAEVAAKPRPARGSAGKPPTVCRRRVAAARGGGRRVGWRRALRGFAAIAAIACVVAGGWGVKRLIALPYFTVRALAVEATGLGGPGMDRAEVERRYLTPHLGEPIFTIDLAALRGELEGDPWVEEAMVARRLPATLAVAVRLREAAALALSGSRSWLLDGEGRLIVETKGGASPALPQIRLRPSQSGLSGQPEAMCRCLRLAEAMALHRFPAPDEVRCLQLDDHGDPVIVASAKGIEILMGRGGYGEKLDRLAAILPDLVDTHRPVARIDLRFKDQAVVEGPG